MSIVEVADLPLDPENLLWVILKCRALSHVDLCLLSVAFAERVIGIYEKTSTSCGSTPRQALDRASSVASGETSNKGDSPLLSAVFAAYAAYSAFSAVNSSYADNAAYSTAYYAAISAGFASIQDSEPDFFRAAKSSSSSERRAQLNLIKKYVISVESLELATMTEGDR